MSDPWVTIIGVGEDGPEGLSGASRDALARADLVFGAPRHLELLGVAGEPYPVPFSIQPILAARGKHVAVLASGDPFWHGAGGSLMEALQPDEWISHPVPSSFQRLANRLGWKMENCLCLGLHAVPLTRLRPLLGQGQRLLVLLRDGQAVAELGTYLAEQGFGLSILHVAERLGGPRERLVKITAQEAHTYTFSAPVAAAIDAVGQGMSQASGLPDDLFAHDGQITKRPFRALTLSALAPRHGEVLWDLGCGSGSVSIEFLLAAQGTTAHAVEADEARGTRAALNAESFGLSHRWHLHRGKALEKLDDLPPPNVVFVGGGASLALLDALWPRLPEGARLVMNGVTLETEALLYAAHGLRGGTLIRIDIAEAGALGSRHGWEAARPVVQWSVTK
ncbi:precorrin-6y C5,15-methyltransferase (decarboxylating) subunit CbiE [Rhodobacter sp. KR11]|uniref:precorrin-6y C5,15-methyltransferase (decarboxylating) subunit CbiE n=1 Tax=Rhodobacter sp. KR11 TaxID=2974588 RepID=UPI002222B83A|nr:precorrin-6y C5,15-methyltransferase (decarboxylating) subunit CbiE [Rhodobacter sp. KR11]MCW1919475.1 precorrin-6y C5,15-methyltransferase (decarboxylating) subunit CbiE [Rhodobacter sp. KR11]